MLFFLLDHLNHSSEIKSHSITQSLPSYLFPVGVPSLTKYTSRQSDILLICSSHFYLLLNMQPQSLIYQIILHYMNFLLYPICLIHNFSWCVNLERKCFSVDTGSVVHTSCLHKQDLISGTCREIAQTCDFCRMREHRNGNVSCRLHLQTSSFPVPLNHLSHYNNRPMTGRAYSKYR